MQGAGNDFLLFDGINNRYKDYSKMAKSLCDRRFGVGGDGIMIAEESSCADIQMVYYNSDGSRGEMCGNGIRCFSKFVFEEGLINKSTIDIETGDGVKTAKLTVKDGEVKEVTISMGKGRECELNRTLYIEDEKVVYSSVVVGVPHVTIVCEDLDKVDINGLGKEIEKHENFPNKTNVNFIEVENKGKIRIKTWERGAGRTLACGTGSSASVLIGNRLGLLDSEVLVETEGGALKINLSQEEIFMTGGAETTFKGEVKWDL